MIAPRRSWRLASVVLCLAAGPVLAQEDDVLEAFFAEEQERDEAPGASEEQEATGGDSGDAPRSEASPPPPPSIVLPAQAPPAATPPPAQRVQRLEEIVVTASKRETSARDIAGSVGAVGGDQLEQLHAAGMEDYLKLVPGVTLAEQGIDNSIPIIRGIATGTTTEFTALTTGIYLDDMPFQDLFSPLSIPNLNPFDLERVEVLKGPQGTLFGSGALAGAVRYIVRKPVLEEFQAKLQYSYSDVSEGSPGSSLGGAVNLPLGQAFALRGVALRRHHGGIYDVVVADQSGSIIRDDRDADRSDQDSWRLLGTWQPSDRLSLSALHFAQESEQDDYFAFANQRQRPARDEQPTASPRESRFGGTNLSGTYRADRFDLLYSGNLLDKQTWQTLYQEGALGLGNQSQTKAPNTIAGWVDGTTHELRLSSPAGGGGSWTWLAGISRLDYSQFIFQYFTVAQTVVGDYVPPRRPSDVSEAEKVSSQLYATIDSRAYENALFGEATRLFGEHWELTLGLRAYQTDLASDTVLSGAQIVALVQQDEYRQSHQLDSRGINPKLSLRYLFSEQMQFYALAAKGFQFGGIQLNPDTDSFVLAAEQNGYQFEPYDSSTLWNYEIGLRSEWLDRRLRFDATLFYMDWTDLQLTVAVPVTPGTPLTPPLTFGLIENVGKAHSQGIELAIDALPWPFLQITSSLSWIEAETDVVFDEGNEDGGVPPGAQLPGAAKLQLSNVLALNLDLPWFEGWQGRLSLTHTHQGEAPDQIRPIDSVGGYDSLDVQAALLPPGHGLWPRLTLALRNLSDERGVSAQAGTDSYRAYSFIQPRTLSLSVDFEF